MTPQPHNANRLALGLMAARGISYDEAIRELEGLTLRLVCNSRVAESAALQAAMLTAVNCGQRAFLGGLQIEMATDIPLRLPWPGQKNLNGVVAELVGGKPASGGHATQTLYFGFSHPAPPKHSLTVQATGWRGGVEPSSTASAFDEHTAPDFALGGVFAGGLAVHRSFLRATALSVFACDEAAGLSLWNHRADWRVASAEGPALRALPESLWLLGLGHLGQAFLWTLGLLPFAAPTQFEAMLQDYDRTEEANSGSGLLCGSRNIGERKTRLCARWLEARGFRTKIFERRFDEHTRRLPDEPTIALCGFDKPEPRRVLENAGFGRVIECGLGGGIHDFDLIHIHTFPGRRAAAEIWKIAASASGVPNQNIARALTPHGEVCGALALETAGKAVSTSFVGAMASAAVFAELLRPLHRGQRHDELYLSPRNFADYDFVEAIVPFQVFEMAEWGFAQVAPTLRNPPVLPVHSQDRLSSAA